MTITSNPDGTVTVTLTTPEKRTLAWVRAQNEDGADTLQSHIEQWFTAQRTARLADDRASMLEKYSALTPAQQADIDAILAQAVVE